MLSLGVGAVPCNTILNESFATSDGLNWSMNTGCAIGSGKLSNPSGGTCQFVQVPLINLTTNTNNYTITLYNFSSGGAGVANGIMRFTTINGSVPIVFDIRGGANAQPGLADGLSRRVCDELGGFGCLGIINITNNTNASIMSPELDWELRLLTNMSVDVIVNGSYRGNLQIVDNASYIFMPGDPGMNMTMRGWSVKNGTSAGSCASVDTPPKINLTINNTSPKRYDLINISANITDEIGLKSANITINFTTGILKINYSISGTSATIYNLTNITDIRGTLLNITIYATDTSNNVAQNSTLITVANTPPTATNVSITPVPLNDGTNAKGHANYSDADGDIVGGNQTYWYVNKTLILEANNSFTLLGGNTTINSNITFSARFNDTFDWSDWVNSTTITVGDVTNPVLNNCTLSATSITDVSGNTINLTCEATDVSNIQTMIAALNGTINKTLTFSFTQATTINPTYVIFQSLETLLVGSYSISQVNVTDASSNKLSNITRDLHFQVTSAPVGGGSGSSGGGGGGGGIIIIEPTKEDCNIEFFPNFTIISQNNIVKKVVIINNEFKTISPTFIINRSDLISLKGELEKIIPIRTTVEYSIVLDNISIFRNDINISENYIDSSIIIKSNECSNIETLVRIQRQFQGINFFQNLKDFLNEDITQVRLTKNTSFRLKFYQILGSIFLITSVPYTRMKKFKKLNFITKSVLILFSTLVISLFIKIFIDLVK